MVALVFLFRLCICAILMCVLMVVYCWSGWVILMSCCRWWSALGLYMGWFCCRYSMPML